MFRFLFAILLCLSFVSGCGSQEFIEHKPTIPTKVREVHWADHSEVAFITSKSVKKAVLIYFSLEDSPGCKLMQQKTFSDPEVAYFINENFIPIKVKGSLDKYKVKSHPTILVLSSTDRTELLRLEQALSPEDLLSYLKLAARVNSLTETMDIMELLNLGDFGLGPL